jgi:hypothetical protein
MPRGSKPGERRGGHQKGVPNKTGRELRELARQYAPAAIKALEEICKNGESEAARVAAANSLLDRGHGKPTTVLVGDVTQRSGEPMHRETVEETAAWIERVLREHEDRNGKTSKQ